MTVLAGFDWGYFFGLFTHMSGFAKFILATVYISVVSQFLGTVLGLISALFGLSRLRALRALSFAYVLVIRGTPVLVQIFFVYFGLPLLFGFDLFPRTMGVFGLSVRGAVIAGIVALSVNEGGYMSEIVRAGITSVDRGQMEAAKSLGMTRGMAMRRIVLPQAARVIVPPLGNEFNNMLKTTSLLFIIGVAETFQYFDIKYSNDFQPAEAFFAAALWYLLLTTIWTMIQARIERKLGRSELTDDSQGFFGRLFGLQSAGQRRALG
jgi:polar amino acid transport system permease protein